MTSPTLTLDQLLDLFPKWYVGTEEQRAACTWIVPARSFVVTAEGNLYLSDGVRMVKDLPLIGGSSQNFVINDTNTSTGAVWSSQHTSDEIAVAVATVGGGGPYDVLGAASLAQSAAQTYADQQTVNGHSGHSITLVPSDIGAVPTSQVGAANGVASLDGTTHVPAAQIPDLSTTYGTAASVTAAQNTATSAQTTANSALQPMSTWVVKTSSYTAADRDSLFLDTSSGSTLQLTLGDLVDKARVRLKWTAGPAQPASNPPTVIGSGATVDSAFSGFGLVGTVVEFIYQKSNTTWWVVDAFRPGTADVQIFLANGTWYKPSGAKQVIAELLSAGGGGGSGSRLASGTASSGGGGGGGGAYNMKRFLGADLPSSVSVTVGQGGAGGAAVTADSTNGNAGGTGGASRFGAGISTYWCWASGGGGGGGGSAGSASGGAAGNGWSDGHAGSGIGAGNPGTAAVVATLGGGAPGGASGAGITAANAFQVGAAGGAPMQATGVTPAGGASDGASGTSGAQQSATSSVIPGTSGGSGASSVIAAGGNGGNGGAFGAGGAGGGASRNGFASGAGGNGAAGIVVVTTYL